MPSTSGPHTTVAMVVTGEVRATVLYNVVQGCAEKGAGTPPGTQLLRLTVSPRAFRIVHVRRELRRHGLEPGLERLPRRARAREVLPSLPRARRRDAVGLVELDYEQRASRASRHVARGVVG